MELNLHVTDDKRRGPICSILRHLDGQLIATGEAGVLTYHGNVTPEQRTAVEVCAQPWHDRLEYERTVW